MPNEHVRVAVTGLGAITALGEGWKATWERILSGQSGIAPIQAWDTSRYRTSMAGEIKSFDPLRHFSPKQARRLDRCHQLAIVASREAVSESGAAYSYDPSRCGIVLGTSLGGMLSGQHYHRALLNRGIHLWPLLYRYMNHVCADVLTAEFGFTGPRCIVSTACTASTIAIGMAIEMIRSGHADMVLAGGADPLSDFSFAGFNSMQNVSRQPCAPFSEPPGLNIGEGAAMLILERLDGAQARKAAIHAELLGYAFNADAYHPTSPDPSAQSQKRLFQLALEDAGCSLDEVDYISAHGTGTTGNDITESRLLEQVLGPRAAAVPISSTKGALGHTLGATGAIEALLTVLAVEHGMAPPTANFTKARPGCTLDYVPNTARPVPIRVAVSENFAFGGSNATLVIGKVRTASRFCVKPLQRVVVTGLGPITPVGCGREQFAGALEYSRCGIKPTQAFPNGAPPGATRAAEIADFVPALYSRADMRRMDRLGMFTICGVELACRDAELKPTREMAPRIGILAGSQHGPIGSCRSFHQEIALGRPDKVNPAVFPNTVANAAVGLASINSRFKGCNAVVTVGEASGLTAITQAYELIRSGAADIMIAGGTDQLDPIVQEGYALAHMVSPFVGGINRGQGEVCRPFDARSNGYVLGEGAGLVVMESLASARSRGATVLAEIRGYHSGAERMGGTDGEGLARCMRTALDLAAAAPAAVDCVAAAGLAHPLYDAAEAAAIHAVFGSRRPPVCALSSVFGMSAATASLSLAAVCLGMQKSFMPCGLNSDQPDQAGALDLIVGRPRRAPIDTALINAMSLGGTVCSLVLRRSVES